MVKLIEVEEKKETKKKKKVDLDKIKKTIKDNQGTIELVADSIEEVFGDKKTKSGKRKRTTKKSSNTLSKLLKLFLNR